MENDNAFALLIKKLILSWQVKAAALLRATNILKDISACSHIHNSSRNGDTAYFSTGILY